MRSLTEIKETLKSNKLRLTTHNLSFFEQNFLIQYDSAQSIPYSTPHCETYSGSPSNCSFDNSNDTIIGFMWFNYSFLNNTTIGNPHQYHRLVNPNSRPESILKNTIKIDYLIDESSLHIYLNGNNELNKKTIIITDINGKIIFTKILIEDDEYISLKFLPAGIYFSQIQSEQSIQVNKLIVIR